MVSFLYFVYVMNDKTSTISAENLINAIYLLYMATVPISLLPLILTSLTNVCDFLKFFNNLFTQSKTMVSFRRLTKFLNLPERGEDCYVKKESHSADGQYAIKMKPANYVWNSQSAFVLKTYF